MDNYSSTKQILDSAFFSRILEFEAGNLKSGNRSTSAEVELWDCSGDKK